MEYGIFVNEDGVHFAELIADALKPVETRSKNMLRTCVGHRVAIISTKRGRRPMIIGHADMVGSLLLSAEYLDANRHLTWIPKGSKYDTGKAKWGYWFQNAERCDPYPLPSSAVRHGRSWCEFGIPEEIMKECTGECECCKHCKRVPGDYDRIDREPRYFCDLEEYYK